MTEASIVQMSRRAFTNTLWKRVHKHGLRWLFFVTVTWPTVLYHFKTSKVSNLENDLKDGVTIATVVRYGYGVRCPFGEGVTYLFHLSCLLKKKQSSLLFCWWIRFESSLAPSLLLPYSKSSVVYQPFSSAEKELKCDVLPVICEFHLKPMIYTFY